MDKSNRRAKVEMSDLSGMGSVGESICPACGYFLACVVVTAEHPLATLALPQSENEALSLPRLPLKFVQCLRCTHVYNTAFDPDEVPYSSKPNNMFNDGAAWRQFINSVGAKLSSRLPVSPSVVEVGHGDGVFLENLQRQFGSGTYRGFDPNGSRTSNDKVAFHETLFSPLDDVAVYRPNLIVCRHVLEHMKNPLAFLQSMTIACCQSNVSPLIYIEVPCVDRVVKFQRINDLYYEHCSQFTTRSFSAMLDLAGLDLVEIGHGYNQEIVYCLAQARPHPGELAVIDQAMDFRNRLELAGTAIRNQLDGLLNEKKLIAIWGGTGKGAAFINFHGLTSDSFPLVIDSDARKIGSYVPGTGQLIQDKSVLKTEPASVILIPTQWRAKDILNEIEANGIQYETALIEHDGCLVDFETTKHPYNS